MLGKKTGLGLETTERLRFTRDSGRLTSDEELGETGIGWARNLGLIPVCMWEKG